MSRPPASRVGTHPPRGRAWLAVAAAAVLLAGCVPATNTVTSPSASVTGDLAQARRDAGIADCPESDPDVAARPDGLPDLTLECLGGGRSVRLAGLRGKPMVINLWAQWCAPCREESPFIRELATKGGDKVFVLGVDYSDPRPELAIEFAGLVGWPQPQVVDPDRRLAPGLRIPGIPVTVFVDADGKVVGRHEGPITSREQLFDLVRSRLGVSL